MTTNPDEPALHPFRLIATDLDGTLLRDDLSISDRTRIALQLARDAGIVVVLVSARPPRVLRRFAEAAGVGGPAICSNGAITYDLDRDAVIESVALDPAVIRRLVLALREAVPGVCFGFEQGPRFACDPTYAMLRTGTLDDAWLVDDALVLAGQSAVKLLVRHPGLRVEELLGPARTVVGEALTITHAGSPYLELSAPGVHKAWALEALCARLGIAAEGVVAFGDMPNDLPMLRWAGCGVAMANAHPEVLAAADAIARSNEEDGVAVYLEGLFTL
jgi:hydroxymethylpyrimidine pyrophosphatase-like HAD family hydrolase